MVFNVLVVLAGLAVLAKGADAFVIGAARLAVTLSMSPVVIGAVVVGFGTGAPKLLVSTLAASRGELDLAVGNVIGSNLANLTLVLGAAGLIARPTTVPRVIRREAPLSLVAVALFALLVQNGLTRPEGFVLVGALVVSVGLILRATEPATETTAGATEVGCWWRNSRLSSTNRARRRPRPARRGPGTFSALSLRHTATSCSGHSLIARLLRCSDPLSPPGPSGLHRAPDLPDGSSMERDLMEPAGFSERGGR